MCVCVCVYVYLFVCLFVCLHAWMHAVPLLGAGIEGSVSSLGVRTPRVSVAFGDTRRMFSVSCSPPYFIRDSPGRPVLQGSDLFVQWCWGESPSRPENIYIGLFYHTTNQFIFPLHWSRPIPNTGSYAWHVDTHFRVSLFI